MSGEYISCKEVIEFLWAYVSDELSPEKRHEFDRHLALCPSCVAYLDSYKKTIEMEKAMVSEIAEEECEEVPEDLVQAVLKARKPRK